MLSSVEETCGPATESKAVPLLRNESEELQETCNPTTEPKSLPFPRQESEEPQDTDKKPDARIPSQIESDDSPPKGKGQFELDNKPDAREPRQVEDKEDLDYNKPASSQLPYPVEDSSHVISNDDDDDVFGSTGIQLIISEITNVFLRGINFHDKQCFYFCREAIVILAQFLETDQ